MVDISEVSSYDPPELVAYSTWLVAGSSVIQWMAALDEVIIGSSISEITGAPRREWW